MARKYHRDKLGRFASKGGSSKPKRDPKTGLLPKPEGRLLKPGEKVPKGMAAMGNAQKGWKVYTMDELKLLDVRNRRPKLGKEGRTGNYTKNQVDAARKRSASVRREVAKIRENRSKRTWEQNNRTPEGKKELDRMFRMGNAIERFDQTFNRAATGKRTRYEYQNRRDLKVPRMNGRKFKTKN